MCPLSPLSPLPQADIPECASLDANGKSPDASPSSDRYGRPEERINSPEELVRERELVDK